MLDKLVLYCTGQHAISVAIQAAGTGYVVGDVLTISGGTFTFAATVKVTTIGGGGAITGVKMWTSGVYTAPAANPRGHTGGTGTGATFNLTYGAVPWTTLRNSTYLTTEKEVILQGIGSGADEVYVGIRTYRDAGPDIFNWELAGFTGFNNALAWNLQPGISPGRWDSGQPVIDGGAYVPLDDVSFPFWFNVTGRRIIVFARPGTSYVQAYLGFLDPFNTDTEWPYPLIISGCSCQKETRFNSSRASLCSIIEPTTKLTAASPSECAGPVMMRQPDGVWKNITNWTEATGAANSTRVIKRTENFVPPGGGFRDNNITMIDTLVLSVQNSWAWRSIRPETGTTPTYELRGVPSTPTHEVLLFPPTILYTTQPVGPGQIGQVWGQYNDVMWAPIAGSGLTSEDEVTFGADTYILFPGPNLANAFDYLALKRSF